MNMGFHRLKGLRAIVTGATAGIGQAIATQLAETGCHLILMGRRQDRLEALATSLEQEFGIEVSYTAFDVRDRDACVRFADSLQGPIDILINNAGLALGFDGIQSANMDHWDTMIDTNVKGLLYMSRLISPIMVKQAKGHILNIGSLAGHEAYANGSAYCATKFAVRAINEAMKKDLHGSGVRVSMVSPGLVNTEFSRVRFEGDQERANSVYAGMEPLTAQDIAEIVLFSLSRPSHVNILDTLVIPTDQSGSTMVHKKQQGS